MSDQTDSSTQKLYYDSLSVARRTSQIVHFVAEHDKVAMFEQIIKNSDKKQTVVITKNKRKADELSAHLKTKEVKAVAIHGNHKAQEYEASSKVFNALELNVIITTDAILQALSLTDIELIISYDLPLKVESYFTRLAELKEIGEAVALVNQDDESLLGTIELVMKLEIAREDVKDFTPSSLSGKKPVKPSKDRTKKPRYSTQKKKKRAKEKEVSDK